MCKLKDEGDKFLIVSSYYFESFDIVSKFYVVLMRHLSTFRNLNFSDLLIRRP